MKKILCVLSTVATLSLMSFVVVPSRNQTKTSTGISQIKSYNESVPIELEDLDDDDWNYLGQVTLYHNCNCCKDCDGELSGETRNAGLYAKVLSNGKVIYRISSMIGYVSVSTFTHSSGQTIGRGRIDDWEFYLYL